MADRELRPRRVASAAAGAVGAFLLSIAGLVVLSTLSLEGSIALRVAVALVGASFAAVIGIWLKFWHCWRDVMWDTGFGAFVSEPEPPYPEARLAWMWARRLRLAGFIYLGVFFLAAAAMMLGLFGVA